MVEPHIDTTLSISDKAFKSMGSDVAWEVRQMPLSVTCAGDPPVSIPLYSAQEVGHRLRFFFLYPNLESDVCLARSSLVVESMPTCLGNRSW